jgi:hypothetical protein
MCNTYRQYDTCCENFLPSFILIFVLQEIKYFYGQNITLTYQFHEEQPKFDGTHGLITMYIRDRHPYQYWIRRIHKIPSRSILVLSSQRQLVLAFPIKTLYAFLRSPSTLHAPSISFSLMLWLNSTYYGVPHYENCTVMLSLLPLLSKYCFQCPLLKTPTYLFCLKISFRVHMITNQNYFQYEGKFYKPTTGVPMGSPLSSRLAEIFLQDIE